MPEMTNTTRASNVAIGLAAYADNVRSDWNRDEIMKDFLTDMHHYARFNDVDLAAMFQAAKEMYEIELKEDSDA